MLRFSKIYFLLTVLIFITEVLIAIYAHDNFIRPYFGDYLVVMLIYCFGMSFISAPIWKIALATLLFSYLIETLQYFNFVGILGLQDSRIANIVIGNSFAWADILAYTLGVFTVVGVEYFLSIKRKSSPVL
ncbi:MAG: DUF2809 domain-containing protein [Bacteroidota bacterium]